RLRGKNRGDLEKTMTADTTHSFNSPGKDWKEINPHDPPAFTLFQWPGSQHCDSIYVRCTKIQRLLGYLKLPYEVADISLPNSHNEAEISDKVKPLMKRIPILRVKNDKYIE